MSPTCPGDSGDRTALPSLFQARLFPTLGAGRVHDLGHAGDLFAGKPKGRKLTKGGCVEDHAVSSMMAGLAIAMAPECFGIALNLGRGRFRARSRVVIA